MTLVFKRMRRKSIHTHTSRARVWRIVIKFFSVFFPFLGKGKRQPSSANLFSPAINKMWQIIKIINTQKTKTKTKRATERERERKRDYARLARKFGQRLRGKGSIIDLICGFKLS